jgi:hypothetical protein
MRRNTDAARCAADDAERMSGNAFQLVNLMVVTTGAGLTMVLAGTKKKRLDRRPKPRRWPRRRV